MPQRKSHVKRIEKVDKYKSSRTSAGAGKMDTICKTSRSKVSSAVTRRQSAKPIVSSRANALAYAVPVLHFDRSQSALMEQYGNHPLHMDALQGNLREMEYHHRRGLPPDCHNSENSTPLMFACLFGQLHAARMLVEAGASKKVLDIFGHGALDYTM